SRGGPGDPGSDEEAHDIEPSPIAAAPAVSGYSLTGSFSTVALLDALPSRRALRSRESVPQIAPFIIAGPASWTDTWGAPRSGPGSLARRHEGQDVFCRYGDPVLASERGYVEFDEGGLGGKVARLHRTDGSYWYYAHLSAWNTRDFASGDRVVPGDIIGYCGNSGNAIDTSPHVHFGLYGSDGRAINPMTYLVRWLRATERRLGLTPIDGRGSNRDASGDPALSRSEAILVRGIPRLDGTGDAFGDPSAGRESARNHQLLTSSSVPLEAALALVAVAMLLLWGYLVREAFSSARPEGAAGGHQSQKSVFMRSS
ncbi:MAG TPA: M23 family metallopeptidase, partial [Actinomycetota bacterium]|nr:M23 family metallopeptidase [Actinomycetota bacterium]